MLTSSKYWFKQLIKKNALERSFLCLAAALD